MKLSRHQRVKLQQVPFYILLIIAVVLLAKISIDTNKQFDWTENQHNSLSKTSIELLKSLKKTVNIKVFVSPKYRKAVSESVNRYQRHSKQIHVEYIDPDLSPNLVRQFNIQQQGELLITSGQKTQHVTDNLSEQVITNAIIRVVRLTSPSMVFIKGHGEREFLDENSSSLTTWATQLRGQGFKLTEQNLTQNPVLPKDTAIIVIAGSTKAWLPGEVAVIQNYVKNGGNLLWLVDPNNSPTLKPLANQLGIQLLEGTVLDPNAVSLRLPDQRFALVADYADQPIGKATSNLSVFIGATGMRLIPTKQPDKAKTDPNKWQYTDLIRSQDKAWVERKPVTANNANSLHYDSNKDIKGPISLSYVMSRKLKDNDKSQQRIVVMGDSDFLSNTYIGTAANLKLAMATANWLGHDDKIVQIAPKTSVGTQLSLTKTESYLIGFGYLLILPLLLISAGILIWWRRRRR